MLILVQMGLTGDATSPMVARWRQIRCCAKTCNSTCPCCCCSRANGQRVGLSTKPEKPAPRPQKHASTPSLEWLGATPLKGKTLYVHAEQEGLGDAIQFCRYLLAAKAQGGRVIFSAPDVLVHLLSSLDADIKVLSLQDVPAQFDYHVALLSLPLALHIAPNNAAPVIPYLHAEAERVAKWRKKIGAHGFKIGVCWSGSINTTNFNFGLERSFALRQLEALSKLAGVRLISLQKGKCRRTG